MKKAKKQLTILSPKWGLFRKGQGLKGHLRDIRIYFQRKKFINEHGYSPVAQWETFMWFTNWAYEILKQYRDHRCGNPTYHPRTGETMVEVEENLTKVWNRYYDEMIFFLDIMKKYDNDEELQLGSSEKDEYYKVIKDKFFKMFSNVFYSLWD